MMNRHAARISFSLIPLIITVLIGGLTSPAFADEAAASGDMILVLDASGSMWGQIDGEPKIEIARRVINDLLSSLPADRRLGLFAYGHNRKGDCADIEELAPVGSSREMIRKAVSELNPKGKTPLSASVRMAAESLRYTEDKATVILVSDGIETCDLDPCAVGTALEEAGIDFTAHVIGFDITVATERAQLECLAANTGGRFLSAANADELTEALQTTLVKPDPVPEVVSVPEGTLIMIATELKDGPKVEGGLHWVVQQAGGGEVKFEGRDLGMAETTVPPGVYDISVDRPADGLSGSLTVFEVPAGKTKTATIALEPSFEASVRTVPEGEGPAGSEVVVYWTGPQREGDYIALSDPGTKDKSYRRYQYVKKGNPLALLLPDEVGEYEIRYVLGKPPTVLARVTIRTGGTTASVATVPSAAAGEEISIDWTGPDYKSDYICISDVGSKDKQYHTYKYSKQGTPAKLRLPEVAGTYEVRYVSGQSASVLARTTVEATDITATVTAPKEAVAGTDLPVNWTGPSYSADYIAVSVPGSRDNSYKAYKYTKSGNPVAVSLPITPGTYEVRYVLGASRSVLARTSVVVQALVVTLDAPKTGDAGGELTVTWSGPDYSGDYIAVCVEGSGDRKYKTYQYTARGNPVSVKLPAEAGKYEIRYITGKDASVLARRPFVVR